MKDKLMKLNIQLFGDEAANTDTPEDNSAQNVVEGESTNVTPNVEDIDKTKSFSTRLKAKTEEIEASYNNKLNRIAKLKGFETWEEYEKHEEDEKIKDLGVQDEAKFKSFIDNVIDKNPKILEAQKIIEANQQKERERYVQQEVEKINKINSKIKTLDDISQLPNCDAIVDKVNKGYSLYDAYVLENLESIKIDNLNAGKANVINSVNSKGHIKTTSGGTSQQVSVPTDILAMYKKNMPKWTEQQIIEHYNKTLGGND